MSEKVSAEIVENRRRWVEALESGEYEQGRMLLRTGEAMCCLGLACELSGLGEWDDGPRAKRYVTPGGGMSFGLPPQPVAALLALPDGEPGDRTFRELSEQNDAGASFAEIAALLRSDDWFGPDLDRVVA